MNKKQLIVAWMLLFILLLINGCLTVTQHPFSYNELYKAIENRSKVYTKVYPYKYDDVYNAIINMLERKLYLEVNRKFTTKDTIFSSLKQGTLKFGWAYAYLFKFRKVDENNTEVLLKASGGVGSISDIDMLDKYLLEELEYIRKVKQNE